MIDNSHLSVCIIKQDENLLGINNEYCCIQKLKTIQQNCIVQ